MFAHSLQNTSLRGLELTLSFYIFTIQTYTMELTSGKILIVLHS